MSRIEEALPRISDLVQGAVTPECWEDEISRECDSEVLGGVQLTVWVSIRCVGEWFMGGQSMDTISRG